jgi:hypothetical protein
MGASDSRTAGPRPDLAVLGGGGLLVDVIDGGGVVVQDLVEQILG